MFIAEKSGISSIFSKDLYILNLILNKKKVI